MNKVCSEARIKLKRHNKGYILVGIKGVLSKRELPKGYIHSTKPYFYRVGSDSIIAVRGNENFCYKNGDFISLKEADDLEAMLNTAGVRLTQIMRSIRQGRLWEGFIELKI